jgi:hypothetical protein
VAINQPGQFFFVAAAQREVMQFAGFSGGQAAVLYIIVRTGNHGE